MAVALGKLVMRNAVGMNRAGENPLFRKSFETAVNGGER